MMSLTVSSTKCIVIFQELDIHSYLYLYLRALYAYMIQFVLWKDRDREKVPFSTFCIHL